MTGTVYKMDSDSLNFAGERSVSEAYYLDDTLGEAGTGQASGTEYSISAGFLQTDDTSTMSLSLSDTALTMSPSLGGLTGGFSDSSTTVNVVTDSSSGYILYIKSSANPTLQSDIDSLNDYSPSEEVPDYEYSVSLGQSNFGFSPEGADIDVRYKNDGESCGTGSSDASEKCWDGLVTTDIMVSSSNIANNPTGTDTVLRFRAGVGANRVQSPGWYYATTTITAVML